MEYNSPPLLYNTHFMYKILCESIVGKNGKTLVNGMEVDKNCFYADHISELIASKLIEDITPKKTKNDEKV